MKREKANYLIQSVSHAVDVLEALGTARGEVGVTELSKVLKLHKNNVFRLLATLELRGYVEQNQNSEDYRLGVKLLELGQAYLLQSNLVQRATPILKRLCEEVSETVSLAVLQNGQVQFPVSFEPKKAVRVGNRVASSFPAKQSAVGRLLMAQLPDPILDELLASNTSIDGAIRVQLAELRKLGRVLDEGAAEADVYSFGRVVRGSGQTVVGAIEVLAPKYRVNVSEIEEALAATAEELTTALGAGKSSLALSLEKEVTVRPQVIG